MKFSIPLFPFLNDNEFNDFITFCKKNSNLIFDVYVTIRMPPFENDAMGINFKDQKDKLIQYAVALQKKNIPTSLTFNNITVSPNKQNYDIFLRNYKEFYDKGIRNITLPFVTWLRFGLKREYPKIFVKNTILSKVSEPAQIYNLFMEGYDYINLDRYLIRDTDRLAEIKKVKDICQKKLNKKLYLSLLMNEHCDGHCPIQQEHFLYNLTNYDNDKTWFRSEMDNISTCNNSLKTKQAIIHPLRSELKHYMQFVDVFKLHGRENRNMFNESINIISKLNSHEIIDQKAIKYDSEWLEKIKNCKWKCYECNLCETMEVRLK